MRLIYVSHCHIILYYNIYYNTRRYVQKKTRLTLYLSNSFFSFFLYQNVHVTEIPACTYIILYQLAYVKFARVGYFNDFSFLFVCVFFTYLQFFMYLFFFSIIMSSVCVYIFSGTNNYLYTQNIIYQLNVRFHLVRASIDLLFCFHNGCSGSARPRLIFNIFNIELFSSE